MATGCGSGILKSVGVAPLSDLAGRTAAALENGNGAVCRVKPERPPGDGMCR